MAILVKQKNPDAMPEGSGKSFYQLQLSEADLTQITAGGMAVIQVILPISDPDAVIEIVKV